MSVESCAALVERGDPDRFLAAMSAPPGPRAPLFVLYAFNLEVARGAWVSTEPLIGQMRLQFWRDVLGEIEAGKPARAHEVATPLADVIRARGLPVALLDGMVIARWADLERAPMRADSLAEYLDATAGNLMWASCVALGASPALEPQARAVGRAQGLANWLLAAPALTARGWQALPDDITPVLDAALSGLAQARRARFGPATPALRAAWRAGGILRRAKADPAAIRGGTLAEPEALRRGRLAWKSLTGRW